jgi:predicted ATP-dependent endonuclease of OLD family
MDHFKNIKLGGWRQFERIDISFDSNVTVLTGANGCGKTTVLNVLARHFGWNINFVSTPFYHSKSKEKIWSDIRKAIESDFEQQPGSAEVGSIEYSNGNICQLIVPEENQAQYSLKYQNQLAITGLNIPSHRPVVSYFQIQNIPTNPKTNQQRHQEFQQLLFQTYGSDHVRNPGVVLKESLVSLALFGYGNEFVQPNAEYRHLFDEFQEILRKMLPRQLGFKKLVVRVPDIVLVTKTGEFPLDAMSGGVSAIFSMAWQIHTYGAETNGCTVIIDEPENHLHPSMQREFLVALRKAFPNYRFIVSTHSPFVVSSDPNAKVYALMFEAGKVVSTHLGQAELASSPNKILREILDVPSTMPVWVEDKIREVLVSVENLQGEEKAARILDALDALGFSDSLNDLRLD